MKLYSWELALHWVIMIGFAATAACGESVPTDPGASVAPAVCWPPESLLPKPDDAVIRKNIAAAYVAPPEMKTPRNPPMPGRVGVVRRVNLPAQAGKLVALTFDLCEQPNEISGYDSNIVAYLRRENIRATFFAGGKWMLTHENAAQQLMGDPLFELGNHSWEHRNLRLVRGAELEKEILAPQVAYQQLRRKLESRQCLDRNLKGFASEHAAQSLSLIRFPFGGCDRTSLDAVSRAGLQAIQWDVSSGDPSFSLAPASMASYVLRAVRPGSIVLFHANGRGWHTAVALPKIVQALKERGYQFLTVGELLRVPGAQWDIQPTCYDNKPGDADHYDDLARRLEVGFQRFQARFVSSSRNDLSAPADPDGGAEQTIIPPAPIPARRIRPIAPASQ